MRLPIPQGKSADEMFSWARNLVRELSGKDGVGSASDSLPAGTILAFAGLEAPTGWVACEGQVLKQIDHRALFKAIDTRFNVGGEGADEFRLPDGRGKVFRGAIAGDFLYGASASVTIGSGPLANNNLNTFNGIWIIKL